MKLVDYFWSPLLFLKWTVWFGYLDDGFDLKNKRPQCVETSHHFFVSPYLKKRVPLSQEGKCQLKLLMALVDGYIFDGKDYLLDLELLDCKSWKVKVH